MSVMWDVRALQKQCWDKCLIESVYQEIYDVDVCFADNKCLVTAIAMANILSRRNQFLEKHLRKSFQ